MKWVWICLQITFWVLPKAGIFSTKFNRRTNVEPCTNAQSKPFSPAFGKPLLAVRCFCFIKSNHTNYVIYAVIFFNTVSVGVNVGNGQKFVKRIFNQVQILSKILNFDCYLITAWNGKFRQPVFL